MVDERNICKIDGITCDNCRNKIKKELLCIKNIKKVEIVTNIAKITYLKKIDEANVIDTINKLGYFTKKDYMSEDIKDIDSDMKLKEFIFILVSIFVSFIITSLYVFILYINNSKNGTIIK